MFAIVCEKRIPTQSLQAEAKNVENSVATSLPSIIDFMPLSRTWYSHTDEEFNNVLYNSIGVKSDWKDVPPLPFSESSTAFEVAGGRFDKFSSVRTHYHNLPRFLPAPLSRPSRRHLISSSASRSCIEGLPMPTANRSLIVGVWWRYCKSIEVPGGRLSLLLAGHQQASNEHPSGLHKGRKPQRRMGHSTYARDDS